MTTTVEPETLVFSLGSPEGRANPYPIFAQLRETAPVLRSMLGGVLLTRYADCEAVLRDPRTRTTQVSSDEIEQHPASVRLTGSLLCKDPPDHTRLRGLVSRAFTPRQVSQLEPAVNAAVAELLEPVRAAAKTGDTVEVMDTLAIPLPVALIGELLGVPRSDRASFREHAHALSRIVDLMVTPEQLAAADTATLEMDAFYRDLIAYRRRNPGDDLISAMIAADDQGDVLDEEELLSMIALLFVAGFETTAGLIGNALVALSENPGERRKLVADAAVVPTAMEELMRWDTPLQLSGRVATAPFEIGDVTVQEGEMIVSFLGAGNRDPQHVPDPERLDLTRAQSRPLFFGGGIHFCLGTALARLEVDAVLRGLRPLIGELDVVGEPERSLSLTLRGFTSLPMRFGTG